MTDDNETQAYKDLVEKYKVKKTTDDCYTPQNVYEAVLKWASAEYGFDPSVAVRPFWPGGDYVSFDYPDGCVVVDNPPFSILSQIIKFYNRVGTRYFLFAPTLTCFNAGRDTCNYVITATEITYQNGVRLPTSFVTNLGNDAVNGSVVLNTILKNVEAENTWKAVRTLRRRFYPSCVITTASVKRLVRFGIPYKVPKGCVCHISKVGVNNTNIFGGGMLLSEDEAMAAEQAEKESELASIKAASAASEAERAAAEAERASAEYIVLSDADRRLQKSIGKKPDMEQGEFEI